MTGWLSIVGSIPGYWAYYVALVLASFLIPTAVRAIGVSYARAIPWVLGGSLFLAVFSITTGFYNGLTDEPHFMPQFLGVLLSGHNPYSYLETFTYVQPQFLTPAITYQWSGRFHYLPFSMFLVIPYAGAYGYEALAVAAWLGTVYLLRKDRWSVLVFGSPSIALMAANGFTDFIPIFLVTAALLATGPQWTRSTCKYVSLGTKQFAPAALAIYYLARRQWMQIAVVVGVTLLILAPFLIWGGLSPVATRVSSQEFQGGWATLFDHPNYYVWPVWAVAGFGPQLYRWSRSAEGAGHYARARRRIDATLDPSWRRLSQCSALGLAYLSAWKSAFQPLPLGASDASERPLHEGDPFEDWTPHRLGPPGRSRDATPTSARPERD